MIYRIGFLVIFSIGFICLSLYLSVQVRNFERLFQHGQFRFLLELDGREERFRPVVQPHRQVRQLHFFRNLLAMLYRRFNENYLDDSLASLFLDDQVAANAKRRAGIDRIADTGDGVGQITVRVLLSILKPTYF